MPIQNHKLQRNKQSWHVFGDQGILALIKHQFIRFHVGLINQMRKAAGITRNKTLFYIESRQRREKKKNRFQNIGKMDTSFQDSHPSISEQMLTSASISNAQDSTCKEVYEKAKVKLTEVAEIQKKISSQAKARLSSFREKDNERYDESISRLASEATNNLVQAQKMLQEMGRKQGKNDEQQKLIDNMCKSLASQIREVSRNLRQQEKQYFDTIRSYEKNTKNSAIELSKQDREVMGAEEEMKEETNDLQNNKIDELVRNINKLSTIYKELNTLVIQQGSLVDRIDLNIETTLQHTRKAVVHLQAADEAASSTFADRVMKILAVMILLLAIVLGLKWAA